jgi:hypothetical protein
MPSTRANHGAPALLVGHSLRGAALLAAAHRIGDRYPVHRTLHGEVEVVSRRLGDSRAPER